MTMGIDYYGVLQIPRTSNDLEIKRAYRKLALEFNPQRVRGSDSGQVFAIIGEAYEVLVDPATRAIFDRFGEEGLKKNYRYHGDPIKTYRCFFGTDSPYADLLVPGHPVEYRYAAKLPKQPPVTHPLALTLREVFFGGVKKMKIRRLTYVDARRDRTEPREKILTIPIQPGLRAGTEIVFADEGDDDPAFLPADVIFVTEDKPDDTFARRGDDLVMTVKVSLEDALIGSVVTITTIDRRVIRVPLTDVVTPTYKKIVVGEGLPILERYPESGNLILEFEVEFPEYLTAASKQMLKEAFGAIKTGTTLQNQVNRVVLADKMKRVKESEQLPSVV
ncbi:dnaJ homolog subfamily B member 13-like [Cylas formicarius]|uniref:dnaJ homolog subfamily B member 13-like n=1 Tax=Cylas formicarius TaxID=197179 RepID=UPI002958BF71|nr:dnaJ homolog subfamily B member 13-like [Cylas formicarius]